MTWGERHVTSLRACSACSGDYEDPERTVPGDLLDENDDQSNAGEDDGDRPRGVQRSAVRDEFPVPEE
jgi:hypothetical protein